VIIVDEFDVVLSLSNKDDQLFAIRSTQTPIDFGLRAFGTYGMVELVGSNAQHGQVCINIISKNLQL
jgi:hypothetical protein